MKAGGANEKPLAAHVSLKVAAVPERGEGPAFPGFSGEGLSPWACLVLGSTQEAPQQGNRQGGAARGGVWEPGLASYHCPTLRPRTAFSLAEGGAWQMSVGPQACSTGSWLPSDVSRAFTGHLPPAIHEPSSPLWEPAPQSVRGKCFLFGPKSRELTAGAEDSPRGGS